MEKIYNIAFLIFFASVCPWISVTKSFAQIPISHYALQFDGNDEIVIPHLDKISFGRSANMTLEVWFKRTGSGAIYQIMGKQEACSDYHNNYQIAGDEEGLYFNSSSGRVNANFNPKINEWTHVAVTYNGVTLSIYINGCLQVEQAYNLGGKSGVSLGIGNSGTCPIEHSFIGLMDEIRIWDVCRTPYEIADYYNISIGPKSKGLVGYWTFDEGMGNKIYDLTSNNKDGLLEDEEAGNQLAWAESDAPIKPHDVVLTENFESNQLGAKISFESAGSYNAKPGIKDITEFGSQKAFGFGVSSCPAFCFDDFATTFKIEFPEPTYVTYFVFKEMELFGNSGSQGQVLLNGKQLTATQDFGRTPINDRQADADFRIRHYNVNASVTSIELKVRDITRRSEIFMDDLRIFTSDITEASSSFGEFTLSPNEPTTLCGGESITLAVPYDKRVQYRWMKNGELMEAESNFINVNESGLFTVNVINNKCDYVIANASTEITFLNIPPAPTILQEGSSEACIGDSVKLSVAFPSEEVSFKWFKNSVPIGGDSNLYYAKEDGIYSLEISNFCGTIYSTNEIKLNFHNCLSGCVIFPNAFSPNEDGLNDEFKPITKCELAAYELLILNRWGEIIFHSNNPEIGWDGYNKNKISLSDTYLFKVTYVYKGDADEFKSQTEHGSVTLLK